VSVSDLAESMRFYSQLFGAALDRLKLQDQLDAIGKASYPSAQ
jgi:predicted enzyme related to lactoylglutathione lyase